MKNSIKIFFLMIIELWKLFLKIIIFIILVFILNIVILLIINYKNIDFDEIFDQCYFKKSFVEKTFSGEFLFTSSGRDSTRICSFLLYETSKNLKNFKKIDKKYFENKKIKSIFNILYHYTKELKEDESKLSKNIIKEIKNWEKEENIFYKFFHIKENLPDYIVCFYNKNKNFGYCLIQHI